MTPLFFILFGLIVVIVAIFLVAASAFLDKSRKAEAFQRVAKSEPAQPRSGRSVPVFVDAPERDSRGADWERWPVIRALSKQITASGLSWTPGGTACAMAGLAASGALLGWILPVLLYQAFSAAALGAVLGASPFLYIRRTRSKRIGEFESQFPDTLDFFGRAIRAGHAFSVSLELLANESAEPTRTEFRRVVAEHNLGAPIETALQGLLERVPLIDVKFFVSAVLLQRETGGNLSQILDNLGQVIRDRFALKGKVKAASAHGRMTAIALTILPIAIVAGFAVISPEYVRTFKQDGDGRMMLLACVVGQTLGYLWMKKIVNIKV